MRSVVKQMIKKAGLKIRKEPVGDIRLQGFYRIQDGSPEIEVLEFLYSLVRLVKPHLVLETGTYAGWSSAVMAQAMVDNKIGHWVISLEIDKRWKDRADKLHHELGLEFNVATYLEDSLKWKVPPDLRGSNETMENPPSCMFDILFLDSEPGLRFKELKKFYQYVLPGGFIIIHDLHPHLGQISSQPNYWPYGDYKPHFGDLIKEHKLVIVNFRTPRGLTVFQKYDPEFESYKLCTSK